LLKKDNLSLIEHLNTLQKDVEKEKEENARHRITINQQAQRLLKVSELDVSFLLFLLLLLLLFYLFFYITIPN
jgi:hypothetical protein